MKKIITTTLIGFAVVGFVYAQEEESFKMPCGDTKTMFTRLKSVYGEEPIVYGREFVRVGDEMSLWVNPSTKGWSIVLSRGDKSCLVGAGSGLTVANFGKSI